MRPFKDWFGQRSMVRVCGVVCAAGLLGAALAPLTAAAAGGRAVVPAVASSHHFTVVATSSNTHSDALTINNSATNNKSHALLFVNADYDAGGACGCHYVDQPIGVYYTGVKWQIVNEDGASIALGTQFNVLVVAAPSANAFVFTSGPTNTIGDASFINKTATNGKKTVKLQVTQTSDGVFDQRAVGVTYSNEFSQWAVFDEDGATMPNGSLFNVLVGTTGGGKLAVQKATSSNSSGDATFINNSATNGKPGAFVLSTPNWNPNGAATGVSDTDPTGVWYDAPSWAVFQEDTSAVPLGAAFNLLLYG
jgi:hypothetical protein